VGHSKKNFSGASRRKLCPSTFKLLPAPLIKVTYISLPYRWSAVGAASASFDDVLKDELTAVLKLEDFEVERHH